MKFYLLALITALGGCSFKKNVLSNQAQNGHEELYSEPELKVEAPKPGTKRLVIAATNDIGGNLGTQVIRIRDSHNKERLHEDVGGADFLASYLRILREKYQSVILVDSGDILPPDQEDYKAIQDFYALLGYDAITPGLSDLSMRYSAGANPVKRFAEGSQVPVVTSNLYELKTARGIEWAGTSPYVLKEINGIKVGIIGILPDDVSALTPFESRVGLYIENMLQSTLHQARRLRSLGAQVIVVLTHQGLDCGKSIAAASKLPLSKVNFEPEKAGACDPRSHLGSYLSRLPAQLVDVVIAGRNHQKVANFINGIAVLSGFEAGKSFSYVELMIDDKTSRPLPEMTVIHQPVMVCREFFKETDDCYPEDPSVDHKDRVPAKFLGSPVERDESVRTKFKKFFDDVSVGQRDEEKLLRDHKADLRFSLKTTGNSHLVVLEVSGRELGHWLEQSYNLDEASLWAPSPFSLEGEHLLLSVQGNALSPSRNYRILTDLESLQNKKALRKYISSGKITSIPQASWKGSLDSDTVAVTASGIDHSASVPE